MAPEEYKDLIQLFLDDKISAWDFTQSFQAEFLKETGDMEDQLYYILDEMWGAAEVYSPDCQPGEETRLRISEQRLREEAAQYLAKLEDYLARKRS